jgi:hypothetical protein
MDILKLQQAFLFMLAKGSFSLNNLGKENAFHVSH